jgi:UDP-2,3-diacylglucosamine hydrolase
MVYYFAADVHAGLSLDERSAGSESRLVEWLDAVGADARAIFLLGDIFDFWFEYRRLVPKGFVRLLGKLAELTGRGVEIHFFPGNHDLWIGDHFERECGMIVHRQALCTTLAGRRIYLAHGDGLGSMKLRERAIHALFHSRTVRKLFSTFVHPGLAMRLGSDWSRHSRKKHLASPYVFHGEKEGIVRFARGYLADHPLDAFVFGHLHTPIAYPLSESTTLYVLGDWISTPHPVYGRLDGAGFSLLPF